jgi:hypothetical protein
MATSDPYNRRRLWSGSGNIRPTLGPFPTDNGGFNSPGFPGRQVSPNLPGNIPGSPPGSPFPGFPPGLPAGNTLGSSNFGIYNESDPENERNWWDDLLEEDPRLAFFSQQGRFGKSPNQKKFYQGSFDRLHKQYLGELGRQVEQGQEPDKRFTDFMRDFNFDRSYENLDPFDRGVVMRRPGRSFLF